MNAYTAARIVSEPIISIEALALGDEFGIFREELAGLEWNDDDSRRQNREQLTEQLDIGPHSCRSLTFQPY